MMFGVWRLCVTHTSSIDRHWTTLNYLTVLFISQRWNRRLTARAKRRDVWKRRSRKHKSSNGRATSSDPWSSSTIRRASTKHRWRKHWTHHRDVTQDSWEKLDQSLLDGYTHGGRYYTKRLMGKYKLLHPTHYRSSEWEKIFQICVYGMARWNELTDILNLHIIHNGHQSCLKTYSIKSLLKN